MDSYRQMHLDLLSRSQNCSQGNLWVWAYAGQCLEQTEQIVGFFMTLGAILFWPAAHICLYRFHRRRSRTTRHRSVRLFVMMNWLSDSMGLVGAAIAEQLASQIIYGLAVTFVHTLCCIHSYITHTGKQNQKPIRDKALRKNRSRFRVCIYPISLLFPAISILAISSTHVSTDSRSADNQTIVTVADTEMIPMTWVFGYVIGAMAGVLHCSVKIIDIFDSYITVECGRSVTVAYLLSICGEIMYIASVFSQSQTIKFFNHTLPWTLPRLIAAGMDIGILIQRGIQKMRGKRRKLSTEDTECLLSSESELDLSDSGSEEVIWMPLKSIESAIPQHPVCASRIQIVSSSEPFSDTIDWVESGSNSMEPFDVFDKHTDEIDADQANIAAETSDNFDDNTSFRSLTQTDTDTLDANQELRHEENNMLEKQISKLNTVSSEEKIATWIHTNSDTNTSRDQSSIQE